MEATGPTYNETNGARPLLQVMVCTFGADGIGRVARSRHPKVEGVEYLVSWQTQDDLRCPKSLERDDFKVIKTATKGLSANRNVAISFATAPILLISDDDVDYTEEGLRAVINAFRSHEDTHIIAFRYESSSHVKPYPSSVCDLADQGNGYYPTSFELAFRRKSVQGKIWFNENFGIGATFPSGEEDIFLRDCLDSGLRGLFLPVTIARHDGTTTSERNLMLPSRPLTKGAVFLRLHPLDWPLRMLAHAVREIRPWREGRVPSPLSYCVNWLKGVSRAKKIKTFPTPDYSLQYPCHD